TGNHLAVLDAVSVGDGATEVEPLFRGPYHAADHVAGVLDDLGMTGGVLLDVEQDPVFHPGEVNPPLRSQHAARAGLAELPDEVPGLVGVGAAEAVGFPAQDHVDGLAAAVLPLAEAQRLVEVGPLRSVPAGPGLVGELADDLDALLRGRPVRPLA